MSPEVALFQPYSHKADIWSVGVVFIALMKLEEPEIRPETFQGRLDAASVVVPDEFKPLRNYVCNSMVVSGEEHRVDIDKMISNDLFSNYYQSVDRKANVWKCAEVLKELNEQKVEKRVADLHQQMNEKYQLQDFVAKAQQQMQVMMQVSLTFGHLN